MGDDFPKIIKVNRKDNIFISKSRIVYDDTQVEVFDVCIKTSKNKIVNALIHEHEYFFCYKLKFKEDNKIESVRLDRGLFYQLAVGRKQ